VNGPVLTPNVTGTPEVLGGIGSDELWFDTSAFNGIQRGRMIKIGMTYDF